MNKLIIIALIGALNTPLLAQRVDTSIHKPLTSDSIVYGPVYELQETTFNFRTFVINGDEDKKKYYKAKYYVNKVWPYYEAALATMTEVDGDLVGMNKKRQKKKYIRSKNKDLKYEFTDQLKKLSMNQGRTLVNLLERETGKTMYEIIKSYRGGFEARKWQVLGSFANYNLKDGYDPYDPENYFLEMVLQEKEQEMLDTAASN